MARLDDDDDERRAVMPGAVDAPFDLSLLPRTATVDADGRLPIGGCDLDGARARARHAAVRVRRGRAARPRAASTATRFGADAVSRTRARRSSARAMARLVAEEGLDLDVATGGELHVALHAGFPPSAIVFHGNNKSDAELAAALDAGVGRIVADSFDELDRLEALVGRRRDRAGACSCA